MTSMVFLFLAVLVIILIVIITHLRIVPETEAHVMERFGVYSRTWHTGLHFKVPFVERCAVVADLREQILVVGEDIYSKDLYPKSKVRTYINGPLKDQDSVEDKEIRDHFRLRNRYNHHPLLGAPKSQPVITKDNVRMEIDTVVFYQITDPKLFAYGHKYPIHAIEHLASTTLRNVVGELELDETLTSRDLINTKLRKVLDEATDAWGIRITRVEIKNIIVSDPELSEAMEKQMIAERKRRADVIDAEGYKKAQILKAEGDKQAVILAAEAAKQKKILEAEGQREADICEGEGEAEKIILVEQAKAEGIKLINASEPTQEYLTIKSLDSLAAVGAGDSNTIIVPSEIQSIAGLVKSASEVIKA